MNVSKFYLLLPIVLLILGCSPEPVPPSPVVSSVPEHNASIQNNINEELNVTTPKPIAYDPPVKQEPKKRGVEKIVKKQRVIPNEEVNNKEENLTIDAAVLNKLVLTNQTRAVRDLLDKSPDSVHKITSKERKIYYLGPSGWRVIDLIEGFRNKKLNEKAVIARIKSTKAPYKRFNYDEIQFLSSQKIPLRVINAMIHVSP